MLRACLAVTFALSLGACASSTAEAPPPGSASGSTSAPPGGEQIGTVGKITGDIWGVTPAGQPTTRYCFDGPLAAPALRREGQEIRFSGTAGPIAPNVRLACSPFTLATVAATGRAGAAQ